MIRWLFACLLLILALVAAAYYFSVPIISYVAADLARQQGVALIDIEFERPGVQGIRIERLVAQRDAVNIDASGIDVAYRLERLLAGRVDEVRIEDLQIDVRAPDADLQPGGEPGGAMAATDLAVLFGIAPRVDVQTLSLRLAEPEFAGAGSFRFDGDTARFELSGREPEIARDIRLDGQLQGDGNMRFALFERDRANLPFLDLAAAYVDTGIDTRAQFDLSGFPLNLVAGLLGLPQGAGRVQGHVSTVLESLDVTAAFRDQPVAGAYAINWRNEFVHIESMRGALTGSLAALQLVLDAGDIVVSPFETRFTVGSGTQVHYADDRITVGSGVAVKVAVLEEIELLCRIKETELDLRDLSLQTAADFSLEGYGLRTSGLLTGGLGMTGDDVDAELVISIADTKLPLTIDYNMKEERGTVAGTAAASGENLLAGFVDQWPFDFDIAAGQLGVSLGAAITGDSVSGSARLDLAGASIVYDGYTFPGTDASLDFAFAQGDVQLRPSEFSVASFDPGVPLANIEGLVAWRDDVLDLQALQFRTLGGTVAVAPTQYDLARGKALVNVTLTGLDLAEVLALEGDDIKGTGLLYGTLPFKVDDGVASMSNGRIHAGEEGGRIELSPDLGVVTGQPGIDFALQALVDFDYETLTAVADYEENGDLKLAVSLQGSNPAIEKGRPIHYNLNINENVFALIEALNAQRGVTDQVERRVLEKHDS